MGGLQAGAVHDLHVDGELLAAVVEDKDADAATARLKSLGEARVQVGLVNDGQALLDVAGLGHGHDVAVLEVKHAVLLEDRAEHGLHDNAGSRVGDEGGLLVQLLGEEVDTKVAVLASGRRGRDADHLARAALEHQEVAEADVVAGDGDGVGKVGLASVRARGRALLVDVDIDMVVVLMAARVNNAVGELVDAVAEGVVVTWRVQSVSSFGPLVAARSILTVLVVVTHVGFLVGAGETGRLNGFVGDLNVLLVGRTGNAGVNSEVVAVGTGLVVRARRAVYGSVVVVLGTEALTILTFSNVNRVCERFVTGVNLNVSVGVLRARSGRTRRCSVSSGGARAWGGRGFSVNQSYSPDPGQGGATT